MTRAQAAVIRSISLSLWNTYGYDKKFAPWADAEKLLKGPSGYDITRIAPEYQAVAKAAKRCEEAAEDVFCGLRDVSLANLNEALLGPQARKVPDPLEVANPDSGALQPFDPIHVWADGSGTLADFPAGCGVVIHYLGYNERKIAWGHPLGAGTNNYAELSGIEKALEAITGEDRIRPVTVHSDSMYALGAASGRNKVNANAELVQRIRKLVVEFRKIEWKHVKGHAGHFENELCDRLAGRAAKEQVFVSEASYELPPTPASEGPRSYYTIGSFQLRAKAAKT